VLRSWPAKGLRHLAGRLLDGGEHDVERFNLRTPGAERFLGSRLRLEE
jgi:hypothetical protein